MTIIERMSKAETAQKMKWSIWHAPAKKAESEPETQDRRRSVEWHSDPASARRLRGAVAVARDQSAAVIGVTGPRPGVGVSVTSRQLAEAVSSFGIRTLFIDLSRVEIVDPAGPEKTAAEVSFLPLAVDLQPALSVVEFDAANAPSLTVNALRAAISQAVQANYTVVLDLPHVLQASGALSPSIAAAGSACDLIFLVCLSGEIKGSDVGSCVEACKIVGLQLGGLILNDWRMPMSDLIAG